MIRHLDPHIAIKHLREQRKVYEIKMGKTGRYEDNNKEWYRLGIESMEKRIEMYS